MKTISQKHNIKISGSGETPIMFAHGFGCSQNAWRRISPAFENDHKVILFDYIGSGKSDISAYDKAKYNSLNGYAEDIVNIGRELNLSDAIFVGHSVSAMIGALASIKDPSLFKKLVFVAPSPCYINEPGYVGGFDQEDIDALLELIEDDYLGWAKNFSAQLISDSGREDLSQEMETNFCTTNEEVVKQFAKVTFLTDNRSDLPNIPVESLTLQCTNDSAAPMEVGNYIHKHTPNNQLIVLNATGHCPHMSHPGETISAIRSFL